ncbi:probable two-component system sensor kinase [Photobacterium aphoticum]|uniref:histidine kinase n=1 Tax=Photobacterium aphoticum TaxID=754436 RepID=A0A090QJC7_9GAMM|nr:probable two-component system sensor kinase [Photobacterium aphoticum]
MNTLPKLTASFHLGSKEGLAFKLFSSFAVSLFIILVLQNLAEAALVRTLLFIPQSIKTQMIDMAEQADTLLKADDPKALAQWEDAQSYTVFVLDKDDQVVSGRAMHPHFRFKLRFARDINTRFDNQVNQPIIAIPLVSGHRIVIKFPHEYHPARTFAYYFIAIKVVIALLILGVLSLLLARKLQAPLNKLQAASHQLAEGDFTVRVRQMVGDSVTEFKVLADSFDHMAQRIEALTAKQQRLIRDVSHELKTPLARHELALHLLKRKLPAEYHTALQRLDTEANEMNTLVDEILAFSQLETGRYQTQLGTVDLHAVCQQQVDEMQHHLQSGLHAGQRLIFAEETDTSAYRVIADQALVNRVLKNTLTNAMKYAGADAIITVSLHRHENQNQEKTVEMRVSDTGKGIAPEHLPSIFDPFTRVQAGREKSAGGYGLGLAIVKESMAIMHGQVKAENTPEGFTLIMTFRAKEENEAEERDKG